MQLHLVSFIHHVVNVRDCYSRTEFFCYTENKEYGNKIFRKLKTPLNVVQRYSGYFFLEIVFLYFSRQIAGTLNKTYQNEKEILILPLRIFSSTEGKKVNLNTFRVTIKKRYVIHNYIS